MKNTILPALQGAVLISVFSTFRSLRPALVANLCFLYFPFLMASTTPVAVHFDEGTVADIQGRAGKEGKLYFLHFAADWCMPCQWMEKNVFTEERLAAYIKEAYLALRVNIDEEEGQQLKEQYQVTLLPSLLVFSSRGQLLGRLEGAVEAEALYEALKQYDRPGHRSPLNLATTSEEILPSPKPILHLSRPALVPDAGQAAARPVLAAGSTTSGSFPYPSNPKEEAYYTLQLGVFSSYDNAVRRCAALERELGVSTKLNPVNRGGRAFYKVFLGRFDSYEQASQYLGHLGQEGFVKKIDI